VGLQWRDHVIIDESLLRPSDISFMVGNSERARTILGWSATVRMPELADRVSDYTTKPFLVDYKI